MNGPWTIEESREAGRTAARQQKAGEAAMRGAARNLAEKERAYRVALAQAITRYRADGHAATVCADLARGNQAVADLRFHRDVAQGVLDAAQQMAWRLAGNRKDTQRFIDWSMRRELAEHGQPDERLAWTGPRAA